MTDFDYEVIPGVYYDWGLTISGYPEGDVMNGDLGDSLRGLFGVEEAIADITEEYAEESGSSMTRVRGAHGWREFTWSDGSVHRYEWEMYPLDMRCAKCKSPDNDLYMVTDEVWASTGLAPDVGWVCYRCVEGLLGRQLAPADFDPNIPANTDTVGHGEELRQRMGLLPN